MHQLEREAQHDPFLMDALEGYQMAGGNQQANLDILAKQLSERTEKKPRRIIPWTTITIAAGVVGFMVVVGLLYKGNNAPTEPKLAQVNLVPKPLADTIDTATVIARFKANDLANLQADKKKLTSTLRSRPTIMAADKKIIANKPVTVSSGDGSLAEVVMSPAPGAKADSGRMPLDEIIIGAISAPKTDTVDMPLTVAIKKRPISQPLAGKADGVNTEPKKPTSAYDLNKYLPGYSPNTAASNNTLPTPGIGAKADNKATIGSTNNANGIYASPASSQNQTADVGYSGFANLKTNASADSVNIAGLNTKLPVINNAAANNAAATRNTADDEDTDPMAAHPAKGWMVFRVYIAKNSYLPAGEKPGVVEVKFTVAADGKLSNIKVTKSLSATADKKALDLITKGPKWKGNLNGKPQEVTQSIGFVNKK